MTDPLLSFNLVPRVQPERKHSNICLGVFLVCDERGLYLFCSWMAGGPKPLMDSKNFTSGFFQNVLSWLQDEGFFDVAPEA